MFECHPSSLFKRGFPCRKVAGPHVDKLALTYSCVCHFGEYMPGRWQNKWFLLGLLTTLPAHHSDNAETQFKKGYPGRTWLLCSPKAASIRQTNLPAKSSAWHHSFRGFVRMGTNHLPFERLGQFQLSSWPPLHPDITGNHLFD